MRSSAGEIQMKNEAGAYYREVYDEHQTEEMQELLDLPTWYSA